MDSLLASLRRILLASILGSCLLIGALALVLRQPSIGSWEQVGSRDASPERLRADVETLTSEFNPRDSDHPENLARAADFIRDSFEASGAIVTEQPFDVGRTTFRNVIATFGSGPHPEVVVGAHYDSFGLFGSNPGADDNASGTAGLLELARLLRGVNLEMRVDLVAYPNEEPPFYASSAMGSAVHARHLREQTDSIWGMVSLEMIGYFSADQPWPSWLHGLLYPDSGDFIGIVGRWQDRRLAGHLKRSMRFSSVPPYSYTSPKILGEIEASDHRSYWAEGFRAVMVTDTAFIRNPNYHTIHDTADTLDYRHMAQVVDGILNGVVRVAQSE